MGSQLCRHNSLRSAWSWSSAAAIIIRRWSRACCRVRGVIPIGAATQSTPGSVPLCHPNHRSASLKCKVEPAARADVSHRGADGVAYVSPAWPGRRISSTETPRVRQRRSRSERALASRLSSWLRRSHHRVVGAGPSHDSRCPRQAVSAVATRRATSVAAPAEAL